MDFVSFDLERWQSRWEHRVAHNLSESGVAPLTVTELLDISGVEADALCSIPLGYAQGNGSDELRDVIAGMYGAGATRDNVVVTTGSSEANFLTCWSLVGPGDEVAVLTPTYRQTWGMARNLGAQVREIALREENGWEPDTSDIDSVIGDRTRLVVVTNPNNPSGQILAPAVLEHLVDRAERFGSWILADEVYCGAELSGARTPSLWGASERVIAVNGLSKAYGLPGLRIGWAVGPAPIVESLWERHDYTVICPTPVSDFLATRALGSREPILDRTRRIVRKNWAALEQWLEQLSLLDWTPPEAGAICLARLPAGVDARALAESLRTSHDLLIVPGDHFGLPGYLRIGFGIPEAELGEALRVLGDGLRELLD